MNCCNYTPTHFDEIKFNQKFNIYTPKVSCEARLSHLSSIEDIQKPGQIVDSDQTVIPDILNIGDYRFWINIDLDNKEIAYSLEDVLEYKKFTIGKPSNNYSYYTSNASHTPVDYNSSASTPGYFYNSNSTTSFTDYWTQGELEDVYLPISYKQEDSFSKKESYSYTTEESALEWLYEKCMDLSNALNIVINIPLIIETSITTGVITKQFLRKFAINIAQNCTNEKAQEEAFNILSQISAGNKELETDWRGYLQESFALFMLKETPIIARGLLKTIVYKDSFKAIWFKSFAENSLTTLRL